MTRKYHVTIARACKEYHHGLIAKDIPDVVLRHELLKLFDGVVSTLADALGEDNRRFDRDRFYAAIYHA